MTQITIRQTGVLTVAPNAELSFDGEPGFPVTIENPFSAAEEERLAWYFEKWLTFPFTDGVKAAEAAASVRRYGETLFAQTIASDERAYSRYRQALAQGVATLHFQIIGDPSFHGLHWEALWDPDRGRPLTLDATIIRSGIEPLSHTVTVKESGTINLLLVTARPHGSRDVGYRTIGRPLVEMLHQTELPVQVDLVRPGTWRALVEHLRQTQQRHGVGHYQIIHFDLHGAVLSRRALGAVEGVSPHSYKVRLRDRFARPDLSAPPDPLDRPTAWLFFEDETGDDLDAASAQEVADLLLDHQIPIAILNACQSGQETGAAETSLGSRLLGAGVQTVVAMGYSVTVSAATQLMGALYRQLFQLPHDLLGAIAAGRTALHDEKQRKANYNQRIPLEDWLLPVVYQTSAQRSRTLPLRALRFEEQIAFFARQSERYTGPQPDYGFVGRDLDILQIEKRLLRSATSAGNEGKSRNLLLIQGMGGAGKSTLLHHLGNWWQTTGLVQEVFYFGYDQKAYHLQELLYTIAQRLLNRNVPAGATVTPAFAGFQAMQLPLQAKLLAQKLRSERHLLILDNLESVTGDPLAIPNTLPVAEQQAIRSFLSELLGGQTFVLLGSRGGAAWLQGGVNPPLRAVDLYPLPGLDAGAAADLAERILARQVADAAKRRAYAADPAFTRLIKLLDGSPLALEVVLSNLARQTPAEIVAALAQGDAGLDDHRPLNADEIALRRTQSIIACIAYSHSNLSPDAQQLLLCLAPFTGVINRDWLPQYSTQLQQQSALAHLPFDRWDEVIDEAINWGLLTPDGELAGYLRVQPIFPYFLRTRLQEETNLYVEMSNAFRLYYDALGQTFTALLESKQPNERQIGFLLVQLEYENLLSAINHALAAKAPISNIYIAIDIFLTLTQNRRYGVELGNYLLSIFDTYSADELTDNLRFDLMRVLGDLGQRQLDMKLYTEATAAYQRADKVIDTFTDRSDQQKAMWKATIYHQLGRVAQAQRQWAQAEQHYQQALALFIEFNDRYSQASTYHQLGRLAEEQENWAAARDYLLKDLEISAEFDDEHGLDITMRSLARLQRAGGDETLPAAVAAVLGVGVAEVAALFAAGAEEEGTEVEL